MMTRTATTLSMDTDVLEEAKRLARINQETIDQFVENSLRRVITSSIHGARGTDPFRRLPTHGRGGLQPGVDLEDKASMEDLLGDP